jgi:hypothetical protein
MNRKWMDNVFLAGTTPMSGGALIAGPIGLTLALLAVILFSAAGMVYAFYLLTNKSDRLYDPQDEE